MYEFISFLMLFSKMSKILCTKAKIYKFIYFITNWTKFNIDI